jgi:hypothetical protein
VTPESDLQVAASLVLWLTKVIQCNTSYVMPGPDPGIHGNQYGRAAERGWPAQARPCRLGKSSVKIRTLVKTAKGKQRFNFIESQSEIKDVKGFSHVRDICCPGEGHHSKLESETINYLRNRLVMMVGNLGHAWFYESLPISRK